MTGECSFKQMKTPAATYLFAGSFDQKARVYYAICASNTAQQLITYDFDTLKQLGPALPIPTSVSSIEVFNF
jgi:hypothetical protein